MPKSHLGYGDPRGSAELRSAIAAYLAGARGVRCDAEQIIVTSGTQHALDLVQRVLLPAGSEAWVEDPGYPLTREVLAAGGVATRPVRVTRRASMSRPASPPRRARGRIHHALAPVPDRRRAVDGPPAGTDRLGKRVGCLDRRGRLCQRVPLWRPAARRASGLG